MESVGWMGSGVQLVIRSVRVVMSRVVIFLFMFLGWLVVFVVRVMVLAFV